MYRTAVMTAVAALFAVATANAPWADPSFDPNAIRIQSEAPVTGVLDAEARPAGSSVIITTDEVDHTRTGSGPARELPAGDAPGALLPFIDWGNDRLIDSLNELPVWGKIQADVAPNGDIYVGILDPDDGATNDTVSFYRSTNGGQTWTYLNRIAGPSGDIRDFTLRVGASGSSVWWYAFVVYDGVAGIYVRRMRPDLTGLQWTQIAAGDTFVRITADRNIENPHHLFAAWETQNGLLRMQSSSDSATTWGNNRNVNANVTRPSVAAGADGYVYIAYLFRNDSTRYHVGRYTNNLISPSFVFNSCDSGPDNRFLNLSVAGARTTPGSSQRAIILATYRYVPNGNIGPRYSWTTNGGTNWSSSFWPPTNVARSTWRAHGPAIRVGYGEPSVFRAIVSMPEPTASFDSIVYAFAYDDSMSNWVGRGVYNDHRATGEFGGAIGISSQTGGGFIAYREYASTRIWFDGWSFTGVAQDPATELPDGRMSAPFGARRIRLGLDRAAPVRATVTDAAGRTRTVLHDGILPAGNHTLSLPALRRGVYFVTVDIAGRRERAKLTLTD